TRFQRVQPPGKVAGATIGCPTVQALIRSYSGILNTFEDALMEARKVDITQLIDSTRLGAFQMGVFILCVACLLMDGFDVQAMGYVAPEILREWKVSPQALGRVLSAAPFGVLIGSLLFSMIADKAGRRPVLIAVTLYFAVLTIVTAMAGSVNQLLII